MIFKRYEPEHGLEQILVCYWTAVSEDAIPKQEKVIPDGFTEIIFHFGDPYRIRFNEHWETQSKSLLAGQLNRYFYLQNTGRSDILGLKFKPAALSRIFPLVMKDLTDRVVDLEVAIGDDFRLLDKAVRDADSLETRMDCLNTYFRKFARDFLPGPVDLAIDALLAHHGMVSVKNLSRIAGLGERQLENVFSSRVGLSPKRYAQIIRFNYIFDLIRKPPFTWTDVAYEAAYYDQSHFIRNFREFTGENPADYAFKEKTMANFFLQKE